MARNRKEIKSAPEAEVLKFYDDPKKRDQIKTLAGHGLRDEEIATFFNTSEATLKRHCSEELANGRIIARAAVQQTAYRLAISGKCPAMTMFWLKTQCRWRETEPEDGNFDPKTKSDDELRAIAAGKKTGARGA